MKHLAILAASISVAVAAWAQTPPPLLLPPPAPSWVNDVVPAGAIKPVAQGPHNCLSAYPAKEQAAHVEGITSLGYRIGEDGSVKAVMIMKSSGNAALDKAAVACVKGWYYQPAILDQKPIEIAWRNDVKWAIGAHPILEFPAPEPILPRMAPPPPLPPPGSPPVVNTTTTLLANHPSVPPPVNALPGSVGRPHICLHDYPPDAVAEHAQGTTTIGFTITVEGHTENIHVVASSGYAALDDAAVDCSRTWRYKPALKDSQPVAVPWKAEVRWLMH